MKNYLIAAVLVSAITASSYASAQEVSQSVTTTLADGTIETRIAKYEQTCSQDGTTKLLNAGIGAGIGYLTGNVAGRVTESKYKTELGIGGAIAGALVASNLDKTRVCEKYVGDTVIRTKNGATTTTFEPAN